MLDGPHTVLIGGDIADVEREERDANELRAHEEEDEERGRGERMLHGIINIHALYKI